MAKSTSTAASSALPTRANSWVQKHVTSSPWRNPAGNLFIRNGERLASCNFATKAALSAAFHAIVGDRKWHYAGSKKIVVENCSAEIWSDIDIDEIVECTPSNDFDFSIHCEQQYRGMSTILIKSDLNFITPPDPISSEMAKPVLDRGENPKARAPRRLGENPRQRDRSDFNGKPPVKRELPIDHMWLADVCKSHNVEPKLARVKLRASGARAGASGWHFHKNDIPHIVKIITAN